MITKLTQIIYDKTKQYYLDQLEILNAQAYNFYLRYIKKGYSDYIIKKKIWYSQIWREAKILFKELKCKILSP